MANKKRNDGLKNLKNRKYGVVNKSSKKRKKYDLKDVVFISIILMLIIINLVLVLKKFIQPKQQQEQEQARIEAYKNQSKNNTPTKKIPQTEDELVEYLAGLTERDRIQYYCGEFFDYIKMENYTAAYNLLYTDFKTNYFPTYEEFEAYIKDAFPTLFALEYDDISRQDNIYVLRLKVLDLSKGKDQQGDNVQRIVIREDGYNDFELSFQVKEQTHTVKIN